MAWLYINTARPSQFELGTLAPGQIRIQTSDGRSHAILLKLANQKITKDLKNLDGICVVAGPGSFSAIRTGVLIANLLSRLWQKPLIGVDLERAQSLEALAEDLATGRLKSQEYVKPEYDMEPNITLPKIS